MLVEFKVKNYKNFKDELIFKLDKVKNYEFNMNAIKHNVVKTSLVYGKNGTGKSNLGFAILDISDVLTDKEKNKFGKSKPFINLLSNENAKFYYKFKFDESYIEYEYEKKSSKDLVSEKVLINGELVIYYNHEKKEGNAHLEGTESLNKDLNDKNISFVKYIANNTILTENTNNAVFNKFIEFVENMLLFSSLENNHYQGYTTGSESISKKIIEKGKVKDLEEFLRSAGIDYDLTEKEIDGDKKLCCKFGDKKINIFAIASRGTCTLILFYYWLLELDKVSFVFIDEFDAFYHNELARVVVKEVLKCKSQAIITTHNTSIMDNDLLRPDCLFNLTNKIESFANSTNKELRKAHNIEKMYKAGSFDE